MQDMQSGFMNGEEEEPHAQVFKKKSGSVSYAVQIGCKADQR